MDDEAAFEMISLAAVTRNVVEFLRYGATAAGKAGVQPASATVADSPGGQASVTAGSLSPEGRELFMPPGETESMMKSCRLAAQVAQTNSSLPISRDATASRQASQRTNV